MATMTLDADEAELLEEIRRLSGDHLRSLRLYVRALARTEARPGRRAASADLRPLVGSITHEDLELMRRAIDEARAPSGADAP